MHNRTGLTLFVFFLKGKNVVKKFVLLKKISFLTLSQCEIFSFWLYQIDISIIQFIIINIHYSVFFLLFSYTFLKESNGKIQDLY